jgi:glycogenin glucosyltransferase
MRTAYVTTLCNGDGYVPGVEALGRSLDRTATVHEKVLLVTPDVPAAARQTLSEGGWRVQQVEVIENPNPSTSQLFARFANTFTKLRAFELTDYDKLVLLDADTIVLQNIDDLFERPNMSAAPDFLLPDRFNSGVLVVEPDKRLFERMLESLLTSESYDGGDQGFLNTFFPDWYTGPAARRLPAGYNLHQFFDAHPEQASGWRRRVHAIEDWSFDQMLRTVLT